MNRFQLLASASVLTILIGPGAAPPVAAQERAGTATAAAPAIQALLDQQERALAVGNPVFRDETIRTGPNGHLHVLLLDESNLTIGPSSELTIDEFVYDPDTGTGRMVMQQAEGVMRFVGGQISKQSPVTVETPAATLGIRGGVVISWLRPDGSQAIIFLFGDRLTVDSKLTGQSADTEQSSIQIIVEPDGSLSGPDPIQQSLLEDATRAVDAPPDGVRRAEVPDSALEALQQRLEETPLETDGAFQEETRTITIQEIEDLLGTGSLDEEQARDLFRELREAQDAETETLPEPEPYP
jgi:hypothetical protein